MASPSFPPATFAFFAQLEENNDREWFRAHRDEHRDLVEAPMRALAERLTAEFGAPKIFRPYRDVRFSQDKRPLQEHAAMAVEAAPGVGALYLQVSADGLFLAGGDWMPDRARLERFRRAVDDDATAAGLGRLLDRLGRAGYPLSDGAPLRTAPRGWPRDHPRIDLLRLTRLTVGRTHPVADWMHDPRLLDRVRRGWRTVALWNDWLAAHMGDPDGG